MKSWSTVFSLSTQAPK